MNWKAVIPGEAPAYKPTEDDTVRFRVVQVPAYQNEKWASPTMLLGQAIAHAVDLNERRVNLPNEACFYVVRPALYKLYEFKP